MEELQEADVLWPADHRDYERRCHHDGAQSSHSTARRAPPRPSSLASAPVRIPAVAATTGLRPKGRTGCYYHYDDDADGTRTDYSGGASTTAPTTIVPPHVFVAARRCSDGRTVASSVCVGHGRTLKGRDLRAVRNTVLHMTGFLGGSDEY